MIDFADVAQFDKRHMNLKSRLPWRSGGSGGAIGAAAAAKLSATFTGFPAGSLFSFSGIGWLFQSNHVSGRKTCGDFGKIVITDSQLYGSVLEQPAIFDIDKSFSFLGK